MPKTARAAQPGLTSPANFFPAVQGLVVEYSAIAGAVDSDANTFTGHPELSTVDSFVFSQYSPGDRQNDGGHVRLGAVHW